VREYVSVIPGRGVLRVTRAAVFAVVCVGLAAAGHTWMSRTGLSRPALAAGFTGAFVVALAAARTEQSFASIAGGLLGGQLLLHLLFSATSPAVGSAARAVPNMPGMPGMANMPMPGMPAHGGLAGLTGSGAAMVAAHIVAAVLTGWWLRSGERAVFTLLRLLAREPVRRLLAMLNTPTARTGRVPSGVCGGNGPGRSPQTLLRFSVIRRGPPGTLSPVV
jgi:hypothetical protein